MPTLVEDSSGFDGVVTISVAGRVPLAGGDLVLDDTFVLRGGGSAFIRVAPPGPYLFRSQREATFNVSGGGTSASGSVFAFESIDIGYFSDGWLIARHTALQPGVWGAVGADISMDVPIEVVSFSAQSNDADVTVGGENSFLVGTASYSGTGFAVPEPVPEPGATILLLVLGVTSIAVWRRRGE